MRAISACCLVVLASACGTGVEDAVPGARRTGVYPNLNIPQQAATEQLTDEEAQSGIASVSAARQGQQAAGGGEAKSEAERLRRLRESHADETLGEIEN